MPGNYVGNITLLNVPSCQSSGPTSGELSKSPPVPYVKREHG